MLKKRLLLLIATLMVVAYIPCIAMADDIVVVNETSGYNAMSLAEAFETADSGDKLVLQTNYVCTADENIIVNENVTLDLNGKDVSVAEGNSTLMSVNGCNLTIKATGSTVKGSICSGTAYAPGDSSLTITGGNFYGIGTDSAISNVDNDYNNNISVKSAVVNGDAGNAVNIYGKGEVLLDTTTLNAKTYINSVAKVTFSNCTSKTDTCIEAGDGKIAIKKGTYTANDTVISLTAGFKAAMGDTAAFDIYSGTFNDLSGIEYVADGTGSYDISKDVAISDKIKITRNTKLNLNGHNVSANKVLATVSNGKTLTINGTNSTVTGILVAGDPSNTSKVDGSLILNGGKYKTTATDTALISNEATSSSSNITVSNATLEAPYRVFAVEGAGKVSISNCTANGGNCLYINESGYANSSESLHAAVTIDGANTDFNAGADKTVIGFNDRDGYFTPDLFLNAEVSIMNGTYNDLSGLAFVGDMGVYTLEKGDYEVNGTFRINHRATLKLNGSKITRKGGGKIAKIYGNKLFTINGSGDAQVNGCWVAGRPEEAIDENPDLKEGRIKFVGGKYISEVKGADLVATTDGCTDCDIEASNATFESAGSVFTIEGGGDVHIDKCHLKGANNIMAKNGMITLSGGEYLTNGNAGDKLFNLAPEFIAQIGKKTKLEIDGGSFNDLSGLQYVTDNAIYNLLSPTTVEETINVTHNCTLNLGTNNVTLDTTKVTDGILAKVSKNKTLKISAADTTEIKGAFVLGAAGSGTGCLDLTSGKYISEVDGLPLIRTAGTGTANDVTANQANFSSKDIALLLESGGNISLTNSQINATTGIYAKAGNITINGGGIYANGEKAEPLTDGTGTTSTGDAIIIDPVKETQGSISLTLKSDKADDVFSKPSLTSENGYAIREAYNDETGVAKHTLKISSGEYVNIHGNDALSATTYFDKSCTNAVSKFAISGGKFIGNPSAYVVAGYAAIRPSENLTENVFKVREEKYVKAIMNGINYEKVADPIILLTDDGGETIALPAKRTISEEITLPAGKRITFDIKDSTFNGTINNKGDLTIVSLSTGTINGITVPKEGTGTPVTAIANNGKLSFTNAFKGTVTNGWTVNKADEALIDNTGDLTIADGKYIQSKNVIVNNAVGAKITATAGEFNSAKSGTAIVNRGYCDMSSGSANVLGGIYTEHSDTQGYVAGYGPFGTLLIGGKTVVTGAITARDNATAKLADGQWIVEVTNGTFHNLFDVKVDSTLTTEQEKAADIAHKQAAAAWQCDDNMVDVTGGIFDAPVAKNCIHGKNVPVYYADGDVYKIEERGDGYDQQVDWVNYLLDQIDKQKLELERLEAKLKLVKDPTGITVSASTTAPKVSWNKYSGADGYVLTYNSKTYTQTGTYKTLSATAGSSKTATLKAYITLSNGEKEYTDAVKFTVSTNPNKVSKPTLSNSAKGKLKTSWKKPTGAVKYQMYLARNSKFTSGKKTYTISSTKSTVTKTVTKLKKGKTYYVKVRAISSAGKYGSWSTTASLKIKK